MRICRDILLSCFLYAWLVSAYSIANQVNPPAWVVAKIYCFYTEVKVYIQYSIHVVIFWLGWGWGVGG